MTPAEIKTLTQITDSIRTFEDKSSAAAVLAAGYLLVLESLGEDVIANAKAIIEPRS